MQRYDFSIDAGVTSTVSPSGITVKKHNVVRGRVIIDDRCILIELDGKDPVVVAALQGTELVIGPDKPASEAAPEIAPVPPPELTDAERRADEKTASDDARAERAINKALDEEHERKRKR